MRTNTKNEKNNASNNVSNKKSFTVHSRRRVFSLWAHRHVWQHLAEDAIVRELVGRRTAEHLSEATDDANLDISNMRMSVLESADNKDGALLVDSFGCPHRPAIRSDAFCKSCGLGVDKCKACDEFYKDYVKSIAECDVADAVRLARVVANI